MRTEKDLFDIVERKGEGDFGDYDITDITAAYSAGSAYRVHHRNGDCFEIKQSIKNMDYNKTILEWKYTFNTNCCGAKKNVSLEMAFELLT